jgi:hypothetical protein
MTDARGEFLPFEPHEHDVRIARAGWIFYVRGVKRGEPFLGRVTWDGTLAGLVMMPVVKAAGVLFHRRAKTWKVGVLRVRDRKMGGRVKVLHKESLEVGDDLLVRIDVLANDVRNGRFDNT